MAVIKRCGKTWISFEVDVQKHNGNIPDSCTPLFIEILQLNWNKMLDDVYLGISYIDLALITRYLTQGTYGVMGFITAWFMIRTGHEASELSTLSSWITFTTICTCMYVWEYGGIYSTLAMQI